MPEQIFSGKYVVQEEIARGGMGVIYKALDRSLHRVVAIKRIHPHLSGDPSFSERFLREARAMARIQHDNIVSIYAVEEDEGTQLLVMEFFGPSNLRTLIRQPHRLPLRDVVRIGEQLASALAYAHGRGIIHRDIKPANVLIDKRGKAKLTDFGIAAALDEASITSTGQVIGTPEYMSPEQARGVKLDGRSDLYSLGIMLYEMVNGKPLYADASKTAILGKLVFEQHELSLQFPDGVPAMLQGVIQDLLRRNPEDRIPDADTLTSQLHEILYTLPENRSATSSGEFETTLVGASKAPSVEDPTRLVSSSTPPVSNPSVKTALHEKTLVQGSSMAQAHAQEFAAARHLEETRLLPSKPPQRQSPSPPPQKVTPPPISPSSSSSLPIGPLLGGGLLLVLVAVALFWYFVLEPEHKQETAVSSTSHESPHDIEQAGERKNKSDELERQRQELAQETERVEEKRRQAEAQQAKEDAERREQERQRERAVQRAREEDQKRKAVEEQKAQLVAQKAKEDADKKEQERQRETALQRAREDDQKRKLAEEEKAQLAAQKAKEDAERREQERQREAALQRAREDEQKRKLAEEEKAQLAAQKAKEDAERREQERQREAALRAREDEQKRKLAEEEKAQLAAQKAKEDAERREQERQRETALRAREDEQRRKAAEQEKALQLTKAFPDAQLQSLLNKFKTAYEQRDLNLLNSVSRMDESRVRQVDVMFNNYTGFKVSIQNIAQTERGATGVLVLESATRANGEIIEVPSMSRKYKLQILRVGNEWDKIVW